MKGRVSAWRVAAKAKAARRRLFFARWTLLSGGTNARSGNGFRPAMRRPIYGSPEPIVLQVFF